MRKKFSRRRDRYRLSAQTVKEIAAEVARLGVLQPGLNLDSYDFAGGKSFAIDPTGLELFIWAQITSGSNPYAWQEVFPLSPGCFIQVKTSGRTGSTSVTPAYEKGGNTSVPAGAVVRIYLASPVNASNRAEYEFEYVGSSGLVIAELATPSAPTLAAVGGTGTTWGYKVVARSATGGTLPSTAATVSGGATLSVSVYITINISTPVPGAVSYDVYRTTAGGTPATTGKIGNILTTSNPLTLNDTGLSASGSLPTYGSSGWRGHNQASPAARVHITSSGAPDIPLRVDAAASQTGNLIEVRDSGGSLLYYIDSGGTPSVGGSIPVNAQTGTTYTVANGDRGKNVTLSNGSAVAVTLPQAGASSQFAAGWYAWFRNLGAGLVTITPTTSTIDGQTSYLLYQYQAVLVISDGTNYLVVPEPAVSTGGRRLLTPPSAAGQAGFNQPSGTAPTSPVSGDEWNTGSVLQFYVNGLTQTMTGAEILDPQQTGTSPLECWYPCTTVTAPSAFPSVSLVAGTYYASPFVVAAPATLDQLGFTCVSTIGATQKFHLGIYSATSTTNLYPSAMVLDTGEQSIAAGASNAAEKYAISQVLQPGVYWAVILPQVSSGSFTVLGYSASTNSQAQGILGSKNDLTTPQVALSKASTYGALAGTFPASATVINANIPQILYRRSA